MRVFSIKSFPPDIMFEIFNKKCYEKNLPLILRTSRILRYAYWAQDWEHPCSVAWLSDFSSDDQSNIANLSNGADSAGDEGSLAVIL